MFSERLTIFAPIATTACTGSGLDTVEFNLQETGCVKIGC